MNFMNVLFYVSIYTMPVTIYGLYSFMNSMASLIRIKKGYVETIILMEGGQAKIKWVKPKSGSLEISKEKKGFFKDAIGYIWRKGFKPFTVYREKDLQQLNLLETSESKTGVSADDISNLITRSFQVGYIKGFKKNQMVNNLIVFVLVGIAGILLINILMFNNINGISNIVKELKAG